MIAIEQAICIAEQAASTAHYAYGAYDASYYAVAEAADAAADVGARAGGAAAVARAAAAAADAEAATAAARAGIDPHLLWLDYDRLFQAAHHEHWTDDTPIPRTFFPPVEQDEQPVGQAEIVLEFDVPECVTDADVVTAVKELLDAGDDLHRVFGGKGIKVSDVTITDDVPSLVPAEGGR